MQLQLKMLAAVLAVAGAVTVGVGTASASNWYQINPTAACKYTYGGGVFGASLYAWSPDAIYCYGLSFPLGITWIGREAAGNFYWYCKAMYGRNADAKVGPGWRNPLNAWYCVLP